MTVFRSLKEFKAHEDEIREWLKRNGVAENDLDHVLHCLEAGIAELYGERPCGGFMQAVLKDKLADAVFSADRINIKYLKQYLLFIHWFIPVSVLEWYRKIRR